jgi:hypothetical protein
MRNYSKLIIISIIFTQLSCQNNSKIEANQAPQYLAKNDEKVLKNRNIIELKKDWDSLTNVKGCLSGGQWIKDKKWGGEGCILTIDKAWNSFLFETHREELAIFLIHQLPDKTTTQIHTCPYENATKGELALYCLQGISKVNFHGLLGFESKKNVRSQKEIWLIQRSDERIEKLQKVWLQHFGFIKM